MSSPVDPWFEHVRVPREAPSTLASLAQRGSVVLVMRSPGLLELLFARWLAPRLGLEPLLITRDDGYLLDANAAVVRDAS